MQDNQTQRVFGLPSVPRESMPSMFEILGWYPQKDQNPPVKDIQEIQQKHEQPIRVANIVSEEKANIIQVQVTNQVGKKSRKKQAKSLTKSGIYQFEDVKLKRNYSQKKCQTVGSKIESVRKIIPQKKTLDPQNTDDAKQIEARKKRIKDFMYVTRDLPNSALTTYEGKPTWQTYGRANSNPNLLTHNVMPHKGQNHPKTIQSYYNALVKSKKVQHSTHVPRKPVEQIQQKVKEQVVEPVNLPLQKPDLINHVRFTAVNQREKKENKIPTNKVTPLQKKNASKSVRKEKKKKQNDKPIDITEDGLKFMNIRQNLLEILERKKINSSKLAWKITECYPFDMEDKAKLKLTLHEWDNTKLAGKKTKKQESVGQLLKFYKQSPF